MTIYFFSGLGADSRVFRRIKTYDHKVVHLDWILPEKKESPQEYAIRLGKDVKPGGIFIGLSFGGLVAQELAKTVQPKQLILLGSVSSPRQFPFYFKLLRPFAFLIPANPGPFRWFINWFMGADSNRSKLLLRSFLTNADTRFIKWAVKSVLNWKQTPLTCPVIKIHGSKDRIFPASKSKADYIIREAGHFFTIDHATELNAILEKYLVV